MLILYDHEKTLVATVGPYILIMFSTSHNKSAKCRHDLSQTINFSSEILIRTVGNEYHSIREVKESTF